MSSVATAVVAGSVVAGKIGADAATDAAALSAGAAADANALTLDMYNTNRDDLAPYRDIATGAPIYDDDGNITGYEGGALNTLADTTKFSTNPDDYITNTPAPTMERSTVGTMPTIGTDVKDFNVKGNVPKYDSNIDLSKDPSYNWRQSEQERMVNRNMAGMGKLMSGNRLEEIMSRSGEMASQEYAAADARNVRDYGIDRSNEATTYGRDMDAYREGANVEDRRYSRGVDAYGRALNVDALNYGREVDDYNMRVAGDTTDYTRGVDDYTRALGAEGDEWNRNALLAGIGTNATNTTAAAGTTAAMNMGANAITAANATGAGIIGAGNATTGAIGDMTALLTANSGMPNPRAPIPPGGLSPDDYVYGGY